MTEYLDKTGSSTGNKTEADTFLYPNGFRTQQFQDGSIKYFLNNEEIKDPAEITRLRNEGQELEICLPVEKNFQKNWCNTRKSC